MVKKFLNRIDPSSLGSNTPSVGRFLGGDGSWSEPYGSINVKLEGAKGDGSTDDTTAVANAYTKAKATGAPLYFPRGMYKLTSLPALDDDARLIGDGKGASRILYPGTGFLSSTTAKHRVVISNLDFWATSTGSLFSLSNCHEWQFKSCMFRSDFTQSSQIATYANSVAIQLKDNTGACRINSCEIRNIGVGIKTSAIQNYVSQTKFGACQIGVLGDSTTNGNDNAGLSIADSEFVGTGFTGSYHIKIDGSANAWWINNTWMENAETGVEVGSASGGPISFGMFNCKIAAKNYGLKMVNCRRPVLFNINLDKDGGSPTLVPLEINASTCAEGSAAGINAYETYWAIPYSVYPAYWNVWGAGDQQLTQQKQTFNIIRPSAGSTADLLSMKDEGYGNLSTVRFDGTVTGKAFWAKAVGPLAANNPSTNQGDIAVFGKTYANKTMLVSGFPGNVAAPMQESLAHNKGTIWYAHGNATTFTTLGMPNLTTVGTPTARNVATTNLATRAKRLGYVSAATAGAFAEVVVPAAQCAAGTSNMGDGSGFYTVITFNNSNAATVSGERMFVGMMNSVAAATNVEPDTLTNCIGVAQLSSDATQWHLVRGGSSAQAKVALGTALGAPTASANLWQLHIYAPNSMANYYFVELLNLTTKATSGIQTIQATSTTVAPQSGMLLAPRLWKTNNTTASAVAFDLSTIYIDTDV